MFILVHLYICVFSSSCKSASLIEILFFMFITISLRCCFLCLQQMYANRHQPTGNLNEGCNVAGRIEVNKVC
jgi:hypothetical protein